MKTNDGAPKEVSHNSRYWGCLVGRRLNPANSDALASSPGLADGPGATGERLVRLLLLWCGFWRLVLFHLLLLSSVLLLELFRLLRVLRFHLLLLRVVVVLLRGLQVLRFLLLFEPLVILRLLGVERGLLLLIFLVGRGVAGVWRRELVLLQFAGFLRRTRYSCRVRLRPEEPCIQRLLLWRR